MTDEAWTTRRILQWIEGYLATHGDSAPRASAQWLVAEALGCDRMHLFLDLERPLSTDERATLRDFTRRRAQGEPLQYITGSAPFRYLTLKVAPGVLIPRPETEVLVSCALDLLPPAPKPQDALDDELARTFTALTSSGETAAAHAQADTAATEAETLASAGETAGGAVKQTPAPLLVVDIGTGSGCIACALASERTDVQVIATDLAPEAVTLARTNVDTLGLCARVEVVQGDLDAPFAPEKRDTFDLIVSNPPYVPTSVLATLPREVAAFEPALALDGGADGLDIFRRLLAFCARALKPKGAFAFELYETTLDDAKQLAEAAGFYECAITADLAGKPRILTARKPA